MEMLLLHRERWLLMYNCSFYDVDRIPVENRRQPIVATILFILFAIFEMFYLPAIFVFRRPAFFKKSCYKFMFWLGCVDIVGLLVADLAAAIFALQGAVFCSSPMLMYSLGVLGFGCFAAQSSLAVILALNRCLSISSGSLLEKLFDGRVAYAWLMPVSMIVFYFTFFLNPIIFNAVGVLWSVNPHYGYFNEFEAKYYNPTHAGYSAFIMVCYVLFYSVFCVTLIHKQISSHVKISTTDKRIFIQVFLISFVNASTALFYILIQLFPMPAFMSMAATFGWGLSHGLPSVFYLLLNPTIQRQVFPTACYLKCLARGHRTVAVKLFSVASDSRQRKTTTVTVAHGSNKPRSLRLASGSGPCTFLTTPN